MLKAHERCSVPQRVKHHGTGCAGSLHTSAMKTHLSLKSLKSPIVLPSEDEMVPLVKPGVFCEGAYQQQPVTALRSLCRGQEGRGSCLTPCRGCLHLPWSWGCPCHFPHPGNQQVSGLRGVPGCKEIGVLSSSQRVCYQRAHPIIPASDL